MGYTASKHDKEGLIYQNLDTSYYILFTHKRSRFHIWDTFNTNINTLKFL